MSLHNQNDKKASNRGEVREEMEYRDARRVEGQKGTESRSD